MCKIIRHMYKKTSDMKTKSFPVSLSGSFLCSITPGFSVVPEKPSPLLHSDVLSVVVQVCLTFPGILISVLFFNQC